MAMSRDLKVTAITATPTTQTQAAGALCHGDVNIVTCANASDAVTIPANLPIGTVIYLVGGANAGTLFPPVGGTINAASANASVALAATVVTVVIVKTATTYAAFKLAAV
jgi:hypothetical protein